MCLRTPSVNSEMPKIFTPDVDHRVPPQSTHNKLEQDWEFNSDKTASSIKSATLSVSPCILLDHVLNFAFDEIYLLAYLIGQGSPYC